jgi:hypothetical protein
MVVKLFKITSVTKDDILIAFEGKDNFSKVMERVGKMTDEDMEDLAAEMADDYLNKLYWNSLRIIFEDKYMEG